MRGEDGAGGRRAREGTIVSEPTPEPSQLAQDGDALRTSFWIRSSFMGFWATLDSACERKGEEVLLVPPSRSNEPGDASPFYPSLPPSLDSCQRHPPPTLIHLTLSSFDRAGEGDADRPSPCPEHPSANAWFNTQLAPPPRPAPAPSSQRKMTERTIFAGVSKSRR